MYKKHSCCFLRRRRCPLNVTGLLQTRVGLWPRRAEIQYAVRLWMHGSARCDRFAYRPALFVCGHAEPGYDKRFACGYTSFGACTRWGGGLRSWWSRTVFFALDRADYHLLCFLRTYCMWSRPCVFVFCFRPTRVFPRQQPGGDSPFVSPHPYTPFHGDLFYDGRKAWRGCTVAIVDQPSKARFYAVVREVEIFV